MLLNYFELSEHPFGVSPDPRFLFETEAHREALASLLYGLSSGAAFIALIANPGMGKTTLLYETLRRIQPSAKTVFLVQPIPSPTALLQLLLTDMGASCSTTDPVDLQLQLNTLLMELHIAGKRLVLVIDEAQNLSDEVLEAVRMLSNFETARQKLIQIVLSGQPGLEDTLRLPRFSQLRQRISIFAGLQPLSAQDTARYIEHRLKTAGCPRANSLFTRSALAWIAASCEGIPRNINKVCFNALTIACALQQPSIGAAAVREALCDSGIARSKDRALGPARSAHWLTRSKTRSDSPESGFGSRLISRWRIHSTPRVALATSAAGLVVALFSWLAVLDYRAIAAEETPDLSTSAYTLPDTRSQTNPASRSLSEPPTAGTVLSKPTQSEECFIDGQPKHCEQGEEGALKP